MKGKENQFVSNLSGGQKQRVAICRALINEPKIILADEPTACLDESNSFNIMELLKEVSMESLVIVVSHDVKLVERYADRIISLKDGCIIDDKEIVHEKPKRKFLIRRNQKKYKKQSISFGFLSKFTFTNYKRKKWRFLFSNLITSFGLIGIGVAVSLNSIISSNIKSAYSSIIDDSSIVASLKTVEEEHYKLGIDNSKVYDIMQNFPDFVEDYGYSYLANYETYFKDTDQMFVIGEDYRTAISGITSRHINEFKWIDTYNPLIVPKPLKELANDEICLGLTSKMMSEICYSLKIERTPSSLQNYLNNKPIQICFEFENKEWRYYDEQVFSLVGFVIEKEACIYHSNHRWNEFVFEDCMSLPTSNKVVESYQSSPWVMSKIPFIRSNNVDDFIKETKQSSFIDNTVFELSNQDMYPLLFKGVDIRKIDRIFLFEKTNNYLTTRYSSYFSKMCPNLQKPIYSSSFGYMIYPEAMMSGFSRLTLFSSSEDDLLEATDTYSHISIEDNVQDDKLNRTMTGHFAKSINNNVKFECIEGNLLFGRVPHTLDEIVITSSLALKLFGYVDVLNLPLFIGLVKSEYQDSKGNVVRNYVNLQLNIVGIKESSRFSILHDSEWTISFFQTRVGISSFDLFINSISFSLGDEKQIENNISSLKKSFPSLEIQNPYSAISDSINEVCNLIKTILLVLSIFSSLISCILLSFCNYLHIIENSKMIGLCRLIGFNQKQSKKFVYSSSIVMCFISFVFSTFEYLFFSVVASIMVSISLNSSFVFSFDISGLLVMLLLCFLIGFVSIMLTVKRVGKISPLA